MNDETYNRTRKALRLADVLIGRFDAAGVAPAGWRTVAEMMGAHGWGLTADLAGGLTPPSASTRSAVYAVLDERAAARAADDDLDVLTGSAVAR